MAAETKRSTGTTSRTPTSTDTREAVSLGRGAFAGIVAGVVFGLMLDSMMDMMTTIGALYGFSNVVAGWIAHLVHSAIFGALYAAVVSHSALAPWGHRELAGAAMGAAYGVVVWLVAASFVMPMWLDAVGFASPSVPSFDPMWLLGHLIYGLVLGVTYPALALIETRRAAPA